MDRKKFLQHTAAILPATLLKGALPGQQIDEATAFRQPPYLKAGDVVGITAPAGFITDKELLPAIERLQSWGFQYLKGNTIGKKDNTFGGTDEERLQDFQQMLDNPDVKAILCARGGYGSVRIVDRIDWSGFRKHPKWVIGFSDITVLHQHIGQNCRVASIHSKMCNSFPDEWSQAEPIQVSTIESIRDALIGHPIQYPVTPSSSNRSGTGEGMLLGGNLKTIESLSGSASDLGVKNAILFVEDTGEYLYSIDRMFWNLKRTNKLAHLSGLIVGGFKIKPDDPGEEFGKSLEQIVLEKVREYNYPVCFDFPVGHQRANFALKCGVKHVLSVSETGVNLIEKV